MTYKEEFTGVASAGYSITVRVKIENRPGQFAKLTQVVAAKGGSIAEVDLIFSSFKQNLRDITINCSSHESALLVLEEITKLESVEIVTHKDDTFEIHKGGKLDVISRCEVHNADQLARAYTPGVARVCQEIYNNPASVYDYTIKSNMIAVITDGSAVLGLGNIGPAAALPVMEGKAILFKQFGGLNSFPICLDTQDTEEIIKTCKLIAPVFAGINLEDISAPRCFEIEERLKNELDIPVFHDDQHGTAVVVLAGVMNATKLLKKDLKSLKVVVNGFGASGVACTKMLMAAGITNIIPCDSQGVIYRGRKEGMNSVKEEIIQKINPDNIKGTISDAIKGADMVLGLSKPKAFTREMILTMAKDPIVFALANPTPEIMPEEIKDIVGVIATGRSDYANQVNNVLCFPGIMKGAIDCRSRVISEGMKFAAAEAIADSVTNLAADNIIPGVFDSNISLKVAQKVKEAAIREGLARI